MRGYEPVSARCRSTRRSARATPTSHASGDGMAFGSTEYRLRPVGQHVGAAARGGAARPGGDVAAVEAGEQVGELVGRAPQVGHEALGDPAQRRVVADGGGRRSPAVVGEGGDPAAALVLDRIERAGGGVRDVDALRGGDGGPQRGDVALGLAGDRQHGVDQRLAVGWLAEDVETAADLGVLEGAQVAVDVADHGAEVVGVGHLVDAEVAGQLAGDEQVPDLAPDRRQLAGVERLDLRVRVEQALEPGGVVVGVGPGHRRRQVVDDHGVGAALGLGALARIVHHERVQQRQVAERGVGHARRRRPDPLARHPLQRPVLAEVDDGVGAVAVLQPAVEREVVVGRRQVGVVVGADRVVAEPAGRLDGDDGGAEVQPGEHEVPVVHRHVAGRRTPRLLDRSRRSPGRVANQAT